MSGTGQKERRGMTPEEMDEMTERIRAWASSPEGQREIRAAHEAAQKVTDELRRARRVPWWRLHEPVTI